MTRKPLPKAIRQPLTNLRDFSASIVPDEEAPAAASRANIDAEPALAISALPAANDPLPASSTETQQQNAKRRLLARKIVDRHRNYAAMGGLLPVPVANIATVTGINLRMVKQLSDLYQVPFQRDRTRSFIVGLVGGAVPTGLGTATSSTLMFVIPGGLLLGLGVSAISAAALTRGIGLVFIESFESGAVAAGAKK